MTSPIFSTDRGDRKEVWQLLQRITEEQRMGWLRWCCRESSGIGGQRLHAVGPGVLGEVFECWKMLCATMGLDMHQSRLELERRVKRTGKPLAVTTGGILLNRMG